MQLPRSVPTTQPRARLAPRFLQQLWRSPVQLLCLTYLALLVLVAVFAPVLAPHEIGHVDVLSRLKPPIGSERADPSYPLGTDALGRDVLSRLLYGARVSLLIGVASTLVAGTLGVTLGLVSGFFGGALDDVIMRLADMQLAFPPILLYIAAMAVLEPSLLNVILVLGVGQWVTFARVVRGEVISVRERDFVEGARASGARALRIILRHVLPNITAPIIVIGSVAVANAVIAEASLSFLGLGVPSSIPSWGQAVAESRPYLRHAPWLLIFPSVALFLTILVVNVVGDWLRDYLDPRLRH